MQFFSIYDLIISRSKERNMTTEDMFSFFSAQKISKATLICLQQTSFLPDKPAFKNAIIDFLGMNLKLSWLWDIFLQNIVNHITIIFHI